MLRRLTDEQVDAVRCEPVVEREREKRVCSVSGTEDEALEPFLTAQVWSLLESYAASLALECGADDNDWGFEYDTDDDYHPDPFEGVRVFVPWDDGVAVSREAFERLMGRYYAAILESVAQQRLTVVKEPWWPAFEANVARLAARVAAREDAPPV